MATTVSLSRSTLRSRVEASPGSRLAPSSRASVSASLAPAPPPKPLLRGVSHQIAFFCALAASAALIVRARPGTPSIVAGVFGLCLMNQLGTSALYHRIDWSPAARRWMRRLDHAAIFLLIGGGYTPLFGLVPSSSGGHAALAAIWFGVAVGVIKSLVWPHAPKWMTALLCVGLGWTVVGQVIDRTAVVGSLSVGLLVASGVIYSLGAVVYATKRPDPLPRVFGYHEVFHALVVLAAMCLFGHVVTVLRAV